MTYEQIKDLKAEEFKRLCGVHRQTFDKMLAALLERQTAKKKSGRPPKLTLEDQLLVALQYWREYRTYFHIAVSWGISESQVCRIVHRVENALLARPEFHLPGKKKLREAGTQFTIIVVDVAESPVERPQKNSASTIVARKSGIPRRHNWWLTKRTARSSA